MRKSSTILPVSGYELVSSSTYTFIVFLKILNYISYLNHISYFFCITGSDINSTDRSTTGLYLATADDFGQVKIFNFPCPKVHWICLLLLLFLLFLFLIFFYEIFTLLLLLISRNFTFFLFYVLILNNLLWLRNSALFIFFILVEGSLRLKFFHLTLNFGKIDKFKISPCVFLFNKIFHDFKIFLTNAK